MTLHNLWTSFPAYREKLSEVQRHILSVVDETPELIRDELGILRTPGKMLRPAFLLLSSTEGNKANEDAVKVAAAIELLHTATLIHDDVIDFSSSRRKKPSLHVRTGIRKAVLAGDFLFSKSLELASSANSDRLVAAVNKGIADICLSEIDQDSGQGDYFISRETYFSRIHGKTAELFALSCKIGALLGGSDDSTAEAFYNAGNNFGIAFQIMDDVLDYRGSVSDMGKPAGNDLKDGIPTLPLILALEDHDPVLERLCRSKQRYLNKNRIRKRVLAGGYADKAAAIGEEYRSACIAGLEAIDFRDKQTFIDLVNSMKYRES